MITTEQRKAIDDKVVQLDVDMADYGTKLETSVAATSAREAAVIAETAAISARDAADAKVSSNILDLRTLLDSLTSPTPVQSDPTPTA